MRTRFAPLFLAALALLAPCSAPAASGGASPWSFNSRNYEVVTDLPRNQAAELAAHLDLVFDEYADRLRAFAPRDHSPVRVYLWRDQETYVRFLADRGINGANTSGLFFMKQGEAGLTAWTRGLDWARIRHVLQHEGFHQFAHLRIGHNIPIWANEGLAEYFGHAVMVGGVLQLGLVPEGRLISLKQALRRREAFSIAELLTLSRQDWNAALEHGDPRSGTLYTQAWSFAHFLIHARGGRYAEAFQNYLLLLNEGRAPDAAFEEAFGAASFAAIEREWISFVADLRPDPLSAAAERLEFLGAGLEVLHQNNVPVESMDELRDVLTAARFKVIRTEHGVSRTLGYTDDRLFKPPFPDGADADGDTSRARSARFRKPAEMTLIPSHDPRFPPTIEITGLRAVVRLMWIIDDDGELSREVMFE